MLPEFDYSKYFNVKFLHFCFSHTFVCNLWTFKTLLQTLTAAVPNKISHLTTFGADRLTWGGLGARFWSGAGAELTVDAAFADADDASWLTTPDATVPFEAANNKMGRFMMQLISFNV